MQAIGEARIALAGPLTEAFGAMTRRPTAWIAATAAAVLAAVALAVVHFREAPPPAPRPLRFFDQFAMWANLGISLFGPLTGALIAATTGSVWLGIAAIVVGCAIGAALLGTSAVFGATTGAPAMVSLRGLLGRRGSVAPTILNIGQNIGWATMEIIVIATAGLRGFKHALFGSVAEKVVRMASCPVLSIRRPPS